MKGVLIALDYQLTPSKRKSIWIKNSQEQQNYSFLSFRDSRAIIDCSH